VYHQIDIFDVNEGKMLKKLCSCHKSSFSMCRDRMKSYILDVPCIACGEIHVYRLRGKKLWSNGINCIVCDKTNTEIAYIGQPMMVRNRITNFDNEVDILIEKLGYNDYFSNVRVMLEVLNRIHDLAEKKRLICECGSQDAELTLLPDGIKVSCKHCSTYRIVFARSNQDLLNFAVTRDLIIYNEAINTARRYKK
jgi:hypothetical protein